MVNILRRVVRRVRAKGLRDTWQAGRYRLYEAYREWSLGIETDEIDRWKGSLENPLQHVYEPLSYTCLDAAFAALDIDPARDVLLDYGAGKGRIVTVAATHPFRRVLGVELLPELVEIARENVRRAGRKLRCKDVQIVVADATTFEVPDDATVAFFFNPFFGDVLRAVQQQLQASLERRPRKLTVIYMNPADEENPFGACAWLVKVRDLPTGRWSGMRFVLYESLAAIPGRRGEPTRAIESAAATPAPSDAFRRAAPEPGSAAQEHPLWLGSL